MHYREFLSIALTLLLGLGIPAQTPGARNYVQWMTRANALYELEEPSVQSDSTALALFLKVSDAASATADGHLAIESLIKAGNIHQGYQRFAEANTLYHRALALNHRQADKAPARYEACLYLGSSMYFNNILDSAKWYFEQASAIESSYAHGERLPERDRLYNSLGAIYFEGANYRQATNYFRKALDFSNWSSSDFTEMYNGIQSNIASCLMKLNRYDSALVILRALKPSVYQENLIRQNTAHCLFELGRSDEALLLYEVIPLDEGYTSVVALTNLGRIYMEKKDWRKAEVVFDSAIARNKRYSQSVRNKEEALSYLHRATLANLQGLTDEAISWSNEALGELFYNFRPKSQTDLPGDSSSSVSPVTAFQVLTAKAAFLMQKFAASGQQSLLNATVRTYRRAIETAAYIRMHFDNDEATLFFNQFNRQVFQQALDAAYLAYSLNAGTADDFLYILESYKGNALLQQMQRLSIRADLQIPDSIFRREKELRQLIGLYTTRLNQTTNAQQENLLQKRLLDLEVELSRLQNSLAQNRRYAENAYHPVRPDISIADVRSALDPHEAVLSYFVGDAYAYCLSVSPRGASILKLPTDSTFQQAFGHFIDAVYQPREGMRYQGQRPAAYLHQSLIEPVLPHVNQATKWIIIPDGKLYLLPFDALVKSPAERDYLLLKKTISYHYAATLLMQERTQNNPVAAQFPYLAVAPFVREDSIIRKAGIQPLPGSADETNDARGKILQGINASRNAFLEAVSNYEILHLATHASTGGDSSRNWIQFYPHQADTLGGRLSINEIYSLDLERTRLVVLSACETAGGAAAGGEGLISLSRAFLYAGADGIISTLWKTEDQVTAFVMKRFRLYQQQGTPPEEALTLAKRDLLKQEGFDARFQSPAYWANFIYTGRVHSSGKTAKLPLMGLGLLTVVGAAFLVLLWKKKTAA